MGANPWNKSHVGINPNEFRIICGADWKERRLPEVGYEQIILNFCAALNF